MVQLPKSFSETFFSFRKLVNVDIVVIIVSIFLFAFGLMMLYSAGGGGFHHWAMPQLKRFVFFIPIAVMIMIVDIRFIYKYAYLFYISGLILLVAADISGYVALGAKRWIKIGPFVLQPSEYMKICVVIALARCFHNTHIYKIDNLWHLVLPAFLAVIPFFLIVKQPDLGTATILLGTAIAIFFLAGVGLKKFIVSGLIILCMIPVLWSSMKDYQKQRVITFLNPESDKLGAGYNIIQSKIAVGSGGLMGKGYLSGSQSQLSFLPERETDFIFTMLAEELGFIGCLIVIGLFFILFFRTYLISIHTRSNFGSLLAGGLGAFLFIHFFVNIAMTLGLIPVVGAPLPLISYGGTMLIITLTAISFIVNVAIHKDEKIDAAKK